MRTPTHKDKPIRIDGVKVDGYRLERIAHRHEAGRCTASTCCCRCYEVEVSEEEIVRVIGLMEEAAWWAPHLKAGGELINPFEEDDESAGYVLESGADGRCVFAYESGAGAMLCSLHSAALELGVDPYGLKPRSCVLWPLALSEERTPTLTVQAGAFEFPCNRRRRPRPDGRLDVGIEHIIESVFGAVFLERWYARRAFGRGGVR